LKISGKEAVTPIGGPALRVRDFRQDDKAGQILIHGAQAVDGPGTEGGIATQAVACIELIHGRGVIDAIDLATTVEADVIRDAGKMPPIGGQVCPGLARPLEAEGRLHVIAFPAGHGRLHFVCALKFLEVQIDKFGFGVEGVDMAGPAFHGEEDDAFGPGRVVGAAFGFFRGKQGSQGDAPQRAAQAVEKVAASHRWFLIR
jgi:hypothetical protein